MDYYSIEQNGAVRELGELINFTVSDFIPATYDAPRQISTTHNQPRFGYPNDFQALVNGGDQTQDYVLGVVIGAMIILIVAIVWFFGIISLKIAGQKRVGFFAGRLVRPDAKAGDENEEKGAVEVVFQGSGGNNEADEAVPVNTSMNNTANDDDRSNKNFNRRVWFVRGTFILSGILVLIAGILFYVNGVAAFKSSIDEVRNGLELVQNAAYKGINLTEDILKQQDNMEEDLQPSQEVVANNGQICGLDSELSTQIRTVYNALITNVDELEKMIDGSLASFGDDLRSLVSLTEDIDNSLYTADIFLYILLAISIIIIVLIIAMLGGVFAAWKGISNCFTKCIQYALIWPLFVFFLVLCWIFATLFLIFSLAGADFCITPDLNVQGLLNRNSDQFDGLIFGFVIFYVSGCAVQPAGADEIVKVADQVITVARYAHDLSQLITNLPIDRLSTICGLSDVEAVALETVALLIHDTTHLLNRAFIGLREVLSCETFNPIYTTFVHDAFCVQGVSGLTYIFSTTLVISIFSMVMIMFRAALYPIKEPNSGSRDDDAVEVVNYKESAPGESNNQSSRVDTDFHVEQEENANNDSAPVIY